MYDKYTDKVWLAAL